MKPFKNLIFDLGDVIIHIDYTVVIGEFQKLATIDFTEIITYANQHHLFDQFETGKISAQQFRDELKQFLKAGVSDAEIDRAWNSIITDYPEPKFALLKELKSRYKTIALSNTNEIHVATIDKAVKSRFGGDGLDGFFHSTYYSNVVGFRKPDKAIYELVLKNENLNPSETFFLDDKVENVVAAKNLGMAAFQLIDRNQLHTLLKDLEII